MTVQFSTASGSSGSWGRSMTCMGLRSAIELEHFLLAVTGRFGDHRIRHGKERAGVLQDEPVARLDERAEICGQNGLGGLDCGIGKCAKGCRHETEGPDDLDRSIAAVSPYDLRPLFTPAQEIGEEPFRRGLPDVLVVDERLHCAVLRTYIPLSRFSVRRTHFTCGYLHIGNVCFDIDTSPGDESSGRRSFCAGSPERCRPNLRRRNCGQSRMRPNRPHFHSSVQRNEYLSFSLHSSWKAFYQNGYILK